MTTFVTSDLDPTEQYKLVTGLVVPRPIGWIGTYDAEGQPNLAPYSFFQAVSGSPPVVLFSGGRANDRPGSKEKDSVVHARESGVFTCNLVNKTLAEGMNASSASLPRGESEFALAGLTPVRGDKVGAPRVAEASASMECEVIKIVELDPPSSSTVVFGQVKAFHVDDDILDGTRINHDRLDAIGRMAGSGYVTTKDGFDLTRPQ